MDTIKFDKKQVKMIAHRGLSGLERENTAAAFIAAGNRGYSGIETDVHLTADGKYIIIHDDRTGRVAGTDLVVEETDFDRLRQLRMPDMDDIVREDLCLPTPEEYLRICKKYGKKAVLELKNPFPKENIAEILEIVKGVSSLDEVIFISFCFQNLIYVRELEASASIQSLSGKKPDASFIDKLASYRCDLDVLYTVLDRETVALLHERGIAVNCWTVDDPAAAAALAEMGVDYITSNILE